MTHMARLALCLSATWLAVRAQKPAGGFCLKDSDCLGYCHTLKCYDGVEFDPCSTNSDCLPGLTCAGALTPQCEAGKPEGAVCGANTDCLGYCQLLKCWDGSNGDRCGKDSDCMSKQCKSSCPICGKRCVCSLC
ncbi:hypothetical protein DIPPA_50783 [Diplonema papillatum]|nr:hypothetical protein DIPPA_50783 [Diplonema papillatum]